MQIELHVDIECSGPSFEPNHDTCLYVQVHLKIQVDPTCDLWDTDVEEESKMEKQATYMDADSRFSHFQAEEFDA